MSNDSLIHPTAVISSTARVGDEVRIGAYTVVGPKVEIGSGCDIGSHCVLKGPTTLGPNNRIYSFASIGDDPQDKKFAGEDTRLEIGSGNTIREYCTINRGTTQDVGVTSLGNDNWIMAYAHIAHDCRLGDHIIMANGSTLGGHVHVGDYAMLSAFAAIHQFCRVGAHSFVGAYGGIAKDVPPYVLVFGTPPKPRGINSEGLQRRGFTAEQVRNLKEAYRLLYRSDTLVAEVVAQLKERVAEQSELQILIEFIEKSERGLIR
ncbi:MAG: acyl-ACP--UDP-N-acetylglucosamine O-acyltransferase [Gammaproteobacteria bacterium]|nr:acyl-ACP--UDP-N-acetylglucosamine O-acyltransferase [Gammaproteobacteria bacterium]